MGAISNGSHANNKFSGLVLLFAIGINIIRHAIQVFKIIHCIVIRVIVINSNPKIISNKDIGNSVVRQILRDFAKA